MYSPVHPLPLGEGARRAGERRQEVRRWSRESSEFRSTIPGHHQIPVSDRTPSRVFTMMSLGRSLTPQSSVQGPFHFPRGVSTLAEAKLERRTRALPTALGREASRYQPDALARGAFRGGPRWRFGLVRAVAAEACAMQAFGALGPPRSRRILGRCPDFAGQCVDETALNVTRFLQKTLGERRGMYVSLPNIGAFLTSRPPKPPVERGPKDIIGSGFAIVLECGSDFFGKERGVILGCRLARNEMKEA